MTQHGPQLRIKLDASQAQKAMADLAAAVGAVVAEISEAFKNVTMAAHDLGVIPEPGPTDPRARALWAKAHRGTGPAVPRNWGRR